MDDVTIINITMQEKYNFEKKMTIFESDLGSD